MSSEFRFSSRFPYSAEQVFAWHAREGAFERLNPPWSPVTVLARDGSIRDGDSITLRQRLGPLSFRWKLVHEGFREGREFRDRALKAPFRKWIHSHLFEPSPSSGRTESVLTDAITYRLPLHSLTAPLVSGALTRELERVFRYRHSTLRSDLALHEKFSGEPRISVAVSGASGLVGRALCAFLSSGGHTVRRLVRHRPAPDSADIYWDHHSGEIESEKLEGVSAVVHLAGEGLFEHRWNKEVKRRIEVSRVQGTSLLARALASRKVKPKVFLCASAIGYYGERGEETLSEASSAGSGFLATVCKRWEEATEEAAQAGVRVANVRIGVVLSARGGALRQMLLPFKLGVGGKIGSGSQWVSWVALDDLISIIYHGLFDARFTGAINAVAPHPIRNKTLTRALGAVLGRPTLCAVPAFAARAAFGEIAEEALLASTRVLPEKLQAAEFEFLYPQLEGTLAHQLGYE